MLDWYSKTVLTIIAIALSVIAIRGPFLASPATAQSDACGSVSDPCYVTVDGTVAVEGAVDINNAVVIETGFGRGLPVEVISMPNQ